MTGGPTLEGISPDQRFQRLYGARHLEIGDIPYDTMSVAATE